MWSNSAAAAAGPAFFNILSSMMMQHQQRQQPGFAIDPLNTGLLTNIGHAAASATTVGTAVNTTAPAANHFYNLNIQAAGSLPGSLPNSLPGSPSFPHSTLPGSLSTAAAAAAAAFSNASLGTSSCGEACDKTCSHCGKVEQRQWRKRGDGTLLCNRCFMWRRNHGGIALPPLDTAPMQPAISKQHSLGPRASSSGGNITHSKHGRHTNLSMNRVLQDLAGLPEAEQEMSHGSRHGSGSYSAPASPARPRSRSGSAASSPARRRRAASPDDPEYRPRGNSKLSRSTSHASDDLSAAAAAAGAAARNSTDTAAALGVGMLQQQGGLSAGPSLSPAAIAKAEQAQAAAAAGAINPHVYRAILTALAAGAPADSIDLVSTQRKFEVMEQQLHVPRSPAAAHLLSRMTAMSP
ncbi:hypothetical protein OEZ85_012461 [Tetradesmus obliquus]|uniref:GATA-type domain-containing protein n=2 Tax=Tetradesmus obliquus TaxID=3088 RepID=A0ABY8TTK2_TETOB|nr:hypothetical protein OEZ85_012461 [Tetradesmus obliquus]